MRCPDTHRVQLMDHSQVFVTAIAGCSEPRFAVMIVSDNGKALRIVVNTEDLNELSNVFHAEIQR